MLDFSIVVFFMVIGLDLQRYNLFFNIQIFLQFFLFFFCDGLRLTLRRLREASLSLRSLRDYETTSLQVAAALGFAVAQQTKG